MDKSEYFLEYLVKLSTIWMKIRRTVYQIKHNPTQKN